MPAKKCFASREELQELYIEKNLSLKELGALFGMSVGGMAKVLQSFSIKKDPKKARENARKTMKVLYGAEDAMNCPRFREKAKETCLRRYNSETPLHSPVIQAKIREVLEAHGGYTLQTEEGRQKVKQTCLERYGVENPMQNENVKEKGKQTCLAFYGATNFFGSEQGKQKVKESLKAKYHVEHYSQTAEYKEKMRQIWQERYGEDWFVQTEEFKQKAQQTNLKRRGVPYAAQSVEVRQKQRETNVLLYGYEFASQSPETQNKTKNTNLRLYGVPYTTMRHYDEVTRVVLSSAEALGEFMDFHQGYSVSELSNLLSCNQSTLDRYISKYGLWYKINQFDSTQERELGALLDEWGLRHSKRKGVIFPYEIDEYCDDLGIGIEMNGNYWHSEEKAGQNYHQKKSLWAESKGVPLFHIYQYEWDNLQEREKLVKKLRVFLGLDEDEVSILPQKIESVIGKERDEKFLARGYSLVGITPPDYVWVNSKQEVISSHTAETESLIKEKGFWKIYDSGKKKWELPQ